MYTTLLLAALLPTVTPTESLLIVTTERINQRSALLDDYVAEKERRGFTVRVATEKDFGGADLVGPDKGALIRHWLQSVHQDFAFLLLIGEAHPAYGDIPMFTVWPRHTYPADNCAGFALDCRSFETDYLYADLTGNWDLNGNGRLGETDLDEGDGGIDLVPELYVGRIPVFFDDVTETDRILQHALDYMNQTEEQAAYRQRALLAASFFYFTGQAMVGYTIHKNVDGAEDAEWFRQNVLSPHNVTATTLYEQAGHVTSQYASDGALTRERFVQEWAKGYGMVFWWGHGLERRVARTVWTHDANNNGRAEGGEMTNPLMIHADDAKNIGSGKPGFVVGVSCEVGSAETPYHLAYTLLLEGSSVGMIGSTNVTPGSATDYADLNAPLDTETTGADNVGIRFFDGLARGDFAGQAFYDAKVELGSPNAVESLAGRTMLNYLGDPSLTLYDSPKEIQQEKEAPRTLEPTDKGSGCSAVAVSTGRPVLFLVLVGLMFYWRRFAFTRKWLNEGVKADDR